MQYYIDTHLFILRKHFQPSAVPLGLCIHEIAPDTHIFERLIARVGGPWGWIQRPKYKDIFARAARLAEPETRLFTFTSESNDVGYGLTHALSHNPEGLECVGPVVEIENFGLFPEYTGHALGGPLLKGLLSRLFEVPGTDAVYLTTRSTNHARVVPFYQKMGMQILRQEAKPDDLICHLRPVA